MILPQVVATKTQGKYNSAAYNRYVIRETSYFNSLDFYLVCKTKYHSATLGESRLIPRLTDKIVFAF